MNKKKIIMTFFVLVIGGMILFLMFAGEDDDQKLEMGFNTTQEVVKSEKSKSQVVTDEIKKEKEKPSVKLDSRKEDKLDFNGLFRKQDEGKEKQTESSKEKNEEGAAETIFAETKEKTIKTSVKSSGVTQPTKKGVKPTNRDVGTGSKFSTEETTESEAAGFSFSTVEEVKKPEEQKINVKGKKGEVAPSFAEISIYGDYACKTGTKVEFVLMENIVIDGMEIKANTIFNGYVKSIGQRIVFRVTSVSKTVRSFDIYDQDLEQGIFNTAFVDNSGGYRETANDIGDEVVTESGATELQLAKELFKGVKGNIKKNNDHGAYLENGKKYYLKY